MGDLHSRCAGRTNQSCEHGRCSVTLEYGPVFGIDRDSRAPDFPVVGAIGVKPPRGVVGMPTCFAGKHAEPRQLAHDRHNRAKTGFRQDMYDPNPV